MSRCRYCRVCVTGGGLPPLGGSVLFSFEGSKPLVAPRCASSPASKADVRSVLRSAAVDSERLVCIVERTELREGSVPAYGEIEKAWRPGE